MKISLFLPQLIPCAAALLCLAIRDLRADILYDNGSPRYIPKTDGFEMTQWIDADDFTLNTSARLENIQFGTIEFGGGFTGSIVWRIYSNSPSNKPGTLLYSGFAPTVAHLPTGYAAGSEVEYFSTFPIQPIVLGPGTYWLALHNGPLSSTANMRVYWEQASTSSPRPSHSDEGPQFPGDWESNAVPAGIPAEVVFRLDGVFGPRVGVTRSGGTPRITFTTSASRFYRVEYKDNLTDSWATVAGANFIPGTGSPIEIPDPDPNIANVPRRFYRVILL